MKLAERERLRLKLCALRDEIVAEGDLTIEPVRKEGVVAGGDDDEQPLTEMSQVIASKRNRERTTVLARVQVALRRLEEAPDDFGQCAECGDPLGRRLEAMPYVEMCVECQQERDGSPRLGRRRHLLDYK